MPLMETSGNVTADAYAGGVAAVPKYIEDYFSTWLYVGNGASRTITNNIDLATKGGMVWSKDRSAAQLAFIQDTARTGTNSALCPSLTGGGGYSNAIDSYTTSGYVISGTGNGPTINPNGDSCVSWSFAKAPKFFDVVTYTGNGSLSRNVSHNLGVKPAVVIIKPISGTGNWIYSYNDAGNDTAMWLNATNAAGLTTVNDGWCVISACTATTFALSNFTTINAVNASGVTYVAYLFASNAGGFGLTGTDNVITCDTFTTTGSNQSINLGYEPQWILLKQANSTGGDWYLIDTMRGWTASYTDQDLFANLSNAESAGSGWSKPTATGFDFSFGVSGRQWIYIAIRRGPMKVPTDATKVFAPVIYTGDGTASRAIFSGGFSPDMVFLRERGAVNYLAPIAQDRLRGTPWLYTPFSDAEVDYGVSTAVGFNSKSNTLISGTTAGTDTNRTAINYSMEVFRRAPSFFDEVCYTGTGSATTVTHNLGVAPELMIFKTRNNGSDWMTYAAPLGATKRLLLNRTNAAATDSFPFANTAPTSTVFTVGTSGDTNPSGLNQVAYLFASCPGVSKVGSYTGNGSTQTINCGFTGGARFVLIKRTDASGDWYVYDTARGMTTLTDPYLLMNSTAAESATLGSVTTVSTGFAVNASVLAAINTSGASYIFFAVS